MDSAEMIEVAFRDARGSGILSSDMSGVGTQPVTRETLRRMAAERDPMESALHLQQLRVQGMIDRDTELLYAPSIFGDTPLVHGPRLWDKGRYAVNVTNTYEDRLDQQRD